MKMAGVEEVSAFVEQNRIRTDPRGYRRVIQEQIRQFDSDGFTMLKPHGLNRQTISGKSGVQESLATLNSQLVRKELVWNDYLAMAAEDHCKD